MQLCSLLHPSTKLPKIVQIGARSLLSKPWELYLFTNSEDEMRDLPQIADTLQYNFEIPYYNS